MISIQVVFPLINAACLAGAGVLVYLSSLIVSQALRVSSKDTIAGDLVLAQLPLAGEHASNPRGAVFTISMGGQERRADPLLTRVPPPLPLSQA